MDAACKLFRDGWWDGARPGDQHAARCAECAAWARARERQRASLAGLARVSAPAELDALVTAELAGDRSPRLERVLSSLARLGAPAELDARVAALLAAPGTAEDRERQRAAALRAMDVVEAPHVLERLLDEELADPGRRRSERFPGSLERLPAPAELDQRLFTTVRRRAVARLVLGPVLALSAAGLVVYLALRGPEPEPRSYRFEIVHATSLEGLDPMARALAESLGGAGPR